MKFLKVIIWRLKITKLYVFSTLKLITFEETLLEIDKLENEIKKIMC